MNLTSANRRDTSKKNTLGNKMFIFMQSKKIRELEQFELNITTCEQQRAAAIRKHINTHTRDERLHKLEEECSRK